MADQNQPSLRAIAARLNLSVATVSMALRKDPRIRPETTLRVQTLADEMGYHSDPVVSEGLSRIRKGVFHRETLAWCFDDAPGNLSWLKDLFQSTENYGRLLGYKLEYFSFENSEPRTLKRLADIWRARGIRGVLFGPFRKEQLDLQFPWADFAWVSIDGAVTQPALNQVGRDYDRDIAAGLDLLIQQGCRRPGFVVEDQQIKTFHRPLLSAALMHNHRSVTRLRQPLIETSTPQPQPFIDWLKENKPDGLLVSRAMHPDFVRLVKDLPMIVLSEYQPQRKLEISFGANYETMGQAAVNFMHRMLTTQNFGIPEYEQSILISSRVRSYQKGAAPSPLGRDLI